MVASEKGSSTVEARADATILSGLLVGIATLAVITCGVGDIASVVLAIVSYWPFCWGEGVHGDW